MKTYEKIWNEFNEDKIFKKTLKIVISSFITYTNFYMYFKGFKNDIILRNFLKHIFTQ
jgi:hypothetical protein